MNVLGLPIPDGYELPFIFTLIIIFVKFALCIFLAYKIIKIRKEKNAVAISFLSGVLFLIMCLFISRILFSIFDFFLTKFDTSTYANFPNVWYWKSASLISLCGIAVLLIVIDKRVMQNKFKGIFGIIVFIAAGLEFLYPVNNFNDFTIASDIDTVGGLCAIFIPILFIWLGVKTPGLRKTSFSMAVGTIIYVFGIALVSANFITLFATTPDVIYATSTILKTIGLSMITYATTHFAA
ncbi:MAG TPA: hypothetical protein VKM55_27990 [Candidatus Lokiarchaeia archaeon]|nr:hypothetical protein [Candidatus Lokiarchaeia archaeon]